MQQHAAKQKLAQQRAQKHIDDSTGAPPQFHQLSKPYIPSSQYLSGVWLESMKDVVLWAKRHMSMVKGKFWCMDHTFRTAKYVRCKDGRQACKSVLTSCNETGQVVAQYFTHTPPLSWRWRRHSGSLQQGTRMGMGLRSAPNFKCLQLLYAITLYQCFLHAIQLHAELIWLVVQSSCCASMHLKCKPYCNVCLDALQVQSVHSKLTWLLVLQDIWVDNSDICGALLKSIFPSVKQVLEDSTHLMRRYMRTLVPDHPQNRMSTV